MKLTKKADEDIITQLEFRKNGILHFLQAEMYSKEGQVCIFVSDVPGEDREKRNRRTPIFLQAFSLKACKKRGCVSVARK